MLNPDFPIIEGKYQMTKDWSINLPDKFNRRFGKESGELIIWKPGFTMWIVVWNNDKNLSPDKQLEWITEEVSKDAFDKKEIKSSDISRFCYRLNEDRDGETVYATYAYVSGKSGYIQIAFYYDSEKNSEMAEEIWKGIYEI